VVGYLTAWGSQYGGGSPESPMRSIFFLIPV
jgi:hypothetical protein